MGFITRYQMTAYNNHITKSHRKWTSSEKDLLNRVHIHMLINFAPKVKQPHQKKKLNKKNFSFFLNM